MTGYLRFPEWISPEVIPGLPIRWYGLLYLGAVAVSYIIFRFQVRRSSLTFHPNEPANLYFWVILGALVGGRMLAVTLYDPSEYYLSKPWLIVWPFSEGAFTGLQGMSYHGALLGGALALLLYCWYRHLQVFVWGDFLAASVPLGYALGRIGSFVNGERLGRVSTAPWAVVFPFAPAYPAELQWVRRTAEEAGMALHTGADFLNLPRHPSQLYEALVVGLLLWTVLWFGIRTRKRFAGAVISWYLMGFGALQFLLGYLREPDPALGFVLSLSSTPNPPHLFVTLLNFTMDQVLCGGMIVLGILTYLVFREVSRRGPQIETFDV